MSLCISVVTPEGIVVAGESRQTQIIAGVNRVGSDSAIKVFALTDTTLAATAGWAFMQPAGEPLARNIASLVDDFKAQIPQGAVVRTVAEMLRTQFDRIYREHVAQFPGAAVPAGQAALNFIVAGYDPGVRVGQLYSVDIPSVAAVSAPARTTDQNSGPWWIGQADVVARIVNGHDPRALGLQSIREASGTTDALRSLSYIVNWHTMTLQDAVDFAVSLIQVTITIQKFTAGIVSHPGAVAGVGGPIDVAVITPGSSVHWVQRKELKVTASP